MSGIKAWWKPIIGLILAAGAWAQGVGAKVPEDGNEALAALFALAIALLGVGSKKAKPDAK